MGIDFDKLLMPYKEGGNKENPVQRTLGTMTSKLMVSNRIPAEIVGPVILKTFMDLEYNGLEFKGNCVHGSKGRDLFNHIRSECIKVTETKTAQRAVEEMMKTSNCSRNCPNRTNEIAIKTRWQKVKCVLIKPRGPLWGY